MAATTVGLDRSISESHSGSATVVTNFLRNHCHVVELGPLARSIRGLHVSKTVLAEIETPQSNCAQSKVPTGMSDGLWCPQ